VILAGLKDYVEEVRTGKFPAADNYFGMKDEDYEELLGLLG